MSPSMPRRIDVHAHFLPPLYQQHCRIYGHSQPDGMPALPDWSPDQHLQLMDKQNISRAILSISTPGTHLVAGDHALAAKVTRECNTYASDLRKKHPDRFGHFASLPIPDVEGCLKEISLAADEGCDGYALLTNGHGCYLGDRVLDPIFDELNRRRAIVFIHPTTPKCPCSPHAMAQGEKPTLATPFEGKYPNPMLEFFFDTARVVTNLFVSGTVARCPNIKFILPHLGGAFPPLLTRWTNFTMLVPGDWIAQSEEQVRETLRNQFWFDLAGFPFPGQIKGLISGVGIETKRIMYGSDFPFTTAKGVEMLAHRMDEGMKEGFAVEEVEDMYWANAERLFGKA